MSKHLLYVPDCQQADVIQLLCEKLFSAGVSIKRDCCGCEEYMESDKCDDCEHPDLLIIVPTSYGKLDELFAEIQRKLTALRKR